MVRLLRKAEVAALFALAAPSAAVAAICPGLGGVAPARPELQAKIAAAFNIPPEGARNAVVRCAGPKLMACVIGANLNCGKADARRLLPGAAAWCRANPSANFIPMHATGHATIYAWRCAAGKAVAGKTVIAVDRQGFFAANWREVPE